MNTRICTVQNRSNKKLEWQFDGQVYELKPREKKPMFEVAANHGYHKLIIDLDPTTGDCTHLIGVEGLTDCSPLEPEKEEPRKELMARKRIEGGEKDAKEIAVKVH